MRIRILRILDAVALACLLPLLIIVAPSFFDPEFRVINSASGPVFAVAVWQEAERELGRMLPGTTREFRVEDDEGAMVFQVSYPDDDIIESEPIYFSNGVKIIATITDENVEVRYDFES